MAKTGNLFGTAWNVAPHCGKNWRDRIELCTAAPSEGGLTPELGHAETDYRPVADPGSPDPPSAR